MIAPSARDTVLRDGTAQLYRFRRPENGPPAEAAAPVLLVPSMINRWYVLDLRAGASLVEALTRAGFDVFCLDWGVPEAEDRYFTWDEVLARLARMVRAVKRRTHSSELSIVGYCMGATLSGIHTALEPEGVKALVNLAGPFDFSKAGALGLMTDARWFDASAVREGGNVSAQQMQAGFVMLRPTQNPAKWVTAADKCHDPLFRIAYEAMETWANDNVSFPAAAYETYIQELYQKNTLVKGEHRVAGRRVSLKEVKCPVLTLTADRDAICPPAAAVALNEHCGARESEVRTVPGGHVGAVVGAQASKVLYPAIVEFLRRHTCN